jgi:putative CocE/NonD family hydrolase
MRRNLFALLLFLIAVPALAQDESQSEYNVEDVLINTSNDGKISAMVVSKKGEMKAHPVVLQYTIYVRDKGGDLKISKQLADRGYVSVVAYSRGKRFSNNEILPYENDAADAHEVIDWIAQQKWCNGKVGMFGGSYNGFTQWAATKRLHPALKTIVPWVAAGPGLGWPMENNIFINPNYEWSFLVGSNQYWDHDTGNDRQRFRNMQDRWWNSGVAYRKMDEVDGQPNRLFQRWISHPSYDEYWQSMIPYKDEFSQINIPVLSIDGYYNDSQISGLHYLREHYKYKPNAEHYLIIGPYSHFGAQQDGQRVVNGYRVDDDALLNTQEITNQWLDHILMDGEKPEVLKGKINYQVMGMNEWRSAPSIKAMSNARLKFYLSNEKSKAFYKLKKVVPNEDGFLEQQVDFSDRATWNNDYYPDPIIKNEPDTRNGFNFISEPLEESILISGAFAGQLRATINKRDFDIGVTLYEVTPDGQYFHLSYFLGRASYAKDMTKRNLLTPGKAETIPFSNTRLVCKKLAKGSRLLVYLNVNKNPFAQLNYGTGKSVSEETVDDAGEALQIKWHNDSFVEIPIFKE